MNTVNLFNIQHFSLQDGDGIRTVVFLKGCPLDCAWCHNPESKKSSPELSFSVSACALCGICEAVCPQSVHRVQDGAHLIDRNKCIHCGKCVDACHYSALSILGRAYSYDEVMHELARDDLFFGDDGGVTFSGGEPFLQFDALFSLLKLCKEKGYSTCIETSGYTKTEQIEQASVYTDCFLFDLKETDEKHHRRYVGADQELILRNLAKLSELSARVVLRCPIIPGVNDRRAHFERIAEIANAHGCVMRVELMPYHPLGIAKSDAIGKECRFAHTAFMEKTDIEALCKDAFSHLRVPYKIN